MGIEVGFAMAKLVHIGAAFILTAIIAIFFLWAGHPGEEFKNQPLSQGRKEITNEPSQNLHERQENASLAGSVSKSEEPAKRLGDLCHSEFECSIYCKENLVECIEFCQENPDNSICKMNMNPPEAQQEALPASGLPSCGSKKEFFVSSHIPPSDLQNIVPLGNFNPSGHVFPTNHLYFQLKGFQGDSSSLKAGVKSPGDIWITRISSSEYVMRGAEIKDYKVEFSVCDRVRGYFIHMTSISTELLEKFSDIKCDDYTTGGTDYRNCEKSFYPGIPIESGKDLGTVGGSSDFGLADLRTGELSYANPSRWYEDPLHRVCPLDYFVPEVKSQLYSLLGDSNKKRTIEPVCGEVDQDEPETLQGVWFLKNTVSTYPEDPHLALAHDNFNPKLGIFSIGTSLKKIGIDMGVYIFDPEVDGKVNSGFDLVGADGNVYCYETRSRFSDSSFAFLIFMPDSESLRIGKKNSGCGSGPWALGSSYVEFER